MLQDIVINWGCDNWGDRTPQSVFVNNESTTLVEDRSSSPTGETGCTRWVFVGDEYVVKIKGFNPDYHAMGELDREIEPEDAKHFAKVVYVDIDKQWFVQERVNCVPNAPFLKEHAAFINALRNKYDLTDVATYDRPHNWTVDIHGIPVIYDYDL